MKKKARLIGVLLLVALGVGLTTFALFSDTEESAQNTFEVGTLNMTVGGADGTAFESINVDNVGVDGTVDGSRTWVIANDGTVPGNLTFQVNDIQNFENGCNEPEAIVDTTCANPGLGEGEFGNALDVGVFLDLGDGAGFQEIVRTDMADANQGEYASQWNSWVTANGPVTIDGGDSVTIRMDWATDPMAYGNEIQSDSLAFGLQFDLLQVVPQ